MSSMLTIELPDELAERLAAASEHRQTPPSQIVQEALDKVLPLKLQETPAPPTGEGSLYDRMKDLIGCVDSGVTDLSTNPKHMEGFGECRK
jgi:hypothetical protein